jgi:hypothetical protein
MVYRASTPAQQQILTTASATATAYAEMDSRHCPGAGLPLCLFSPSDSGQRTARRQTPSALNARDSARVSSASCTNLTFPAPRRGDPRRSACTVCPSTRRVPGHRTHRIPGRAFRSKSGRSRTGNPVLAPEGRSGSPESPRALSARVDGWQLDDAVVSNKGGGGVLDRDR